MRLLVCGGRNFKDSDAMAYELGAIDEAFGITHIIHGAARGADMLAGEWGKANGKHVLSYPANWSSHGRAAGPIRNRQMLEDGKPDVVAAFPGGRGTDNMIKQARAAGVLVFRFTSRADQ